MRKNKYHDRKKKKKDTNRLIEKELDKKVIFKIKTEIQEGISIRFNAANR